MKKGKKEKKKIERIKIDFLRTFLTISALPTAATTMSALRTVPDEMS